MYQEDGQNKLVKLALVLYHQEESDVPKTKTEADPNRETVQEGPGARTMVMNLRKDLYSDNDSK